MGTALQQLMPNVGEPKQGSRALLATVVNSVLLYGSPLWGAHAHNDAVIKNMAPVQRRIALRVISGYRTISLGATLLLAGMAPIWLLAKEEPTCGRGSNGRMRQTPLDIKREAQAALLQEWQGELSAYPKGRWTDTLIRNVKEWTTRDHGRIDYWITQALGGHGCFSAFLFKYKKRSYPTFQDCGAGSDDAEHAFFRCRVYTEERVQLQHSIDAPFRARDSGRSYAARAGILGQYCVLLQALNHKKDGKRSGNTANDQPRILELEGQCSKRCVCLCARE